MDKAPTNPRDKAKENLITVITNVVIIANGIKISEKYSLSLRLLESFIYADFIINAKNAETKMAIIKLL